MRIGRGHTFITAPRLWPASSERLITFGRQPAGANPVRLGFVEDHALHTAVHDAVSIIPIGVAHPGRRLVRLVIVDENCLLTELIRKVAVVLAGFIAVDGRGWSAVVRVVVVHCDR